MQQQGFVLLGELGHWLLPTLRHHYCVRDDAT
jgi:hypothetical protein